MYEFDHILHGKGSRQHVQDMIREAQQDKLAREVEAATQDERKLIAPLRVLLATVLHLIGR